MRTALRSGVTVLLFLLSFPTAWAFEVTGLSTPESFIVDEETGNYFISNVNGSPADKDNNGFITRLDPQGKPLQQKFISPCQVRYKKNCVEESVCNSIRVINRTK